MALRRPAFRRVSTLKWKFSGYRAARRSCNSPNIANAGHSRRLLLLMDFVIAMPINLAEGSGRFRKPPDMIIPATGRSARRAAQPKPSIDGDHSFPTRPANIAADAPNTGDIAWSTPGSTLSRNVYAPSRRTAEKPPGAV